MFLHACTSGEREREGRGGGGRAADITAEKMLHKSPPTPPHTVTGRSVVHLHQSKVRGDAEGMRRKPYAAARCRRVIRTTFLHTMALGGLGPSFSLYVWSTSSSLMSSGGTLLPLLPLPDVRRCSSGFFSRASASVIVAAVRAMLWHGGERERHVGGASHTVHTRCYNKRVHL